MKENVSIFQEFIGKYQIEKPGEKLITCIKKYTFLYASEKLNLNENPLIQENLRQTKTLLVKKYQNKSKLQSYHGYILSFEKTLIIIDNLSVDIFNELLTINPKLSFLFYHKNKINETGVEKIKIIIPHEEFDKEVEALSQSINLNVPKNTTIHSLYLIFRSCIACYLIQKSYQKLNKNRHENQNSESQNTNLLNNIEESDYIELRFIDVGSSFLVYLIYLIEKEELLVIKKPKNQNQKLIERVCNNCPYLSHPFFPKFYGKVKNTDYLVMEFIYGKKLNSININEYSDSDI